MDSQECPPLFLVDSGPQGPQPRRPHKRHCHSPENIPPPASATKNNHGPALSFHHPRNCRSEEVTRRRRQEQPSLPPSPPYESTTGHSAPLPADVEADQGPSWHRLPRVLGMPVGMNGAGMMPADRVHGGSGESSGQSDRRVSSLFGSGSGKRLDAVLVVAKRMASAAQNSSIAGVPEVCTSKCVGGGGGVEREGGWGRGREGGRGKKTRRRV